MNKISLAIISMALILISPLLSSADSKVSPIIEGKISELSEMVTTRSASQDLDLSKLSAL